MSKRILLIWLLPLLCLLIIASVAQAAIITACSFDKEVYNQGESGYVSVTIFNDNEDTIRVTRLTATIDYYYASGDIYVQAFSANTTLPAEIPQGEPDVFYIPFTLPTNIASGYTDVFVYAETDVWNNQSQRWFASDHPTYWAKLYIESPYKQQFEDQQAANDDLLDQLLEQQAQNFQLEEQLQELQVVHSITANIMYLLLVTTIIFAAVTVFFFIFGRKARVAQQPAG